MYFSFKVVIFTLCLHFASCSVGTYKAAYVADDFTLLNYADLVHEASKMNADILVLPSPEVPRSENNLEICSAEKNDETVKSISDASKKGKLYVVAHLLEKMRCQSQQEVIRNNLVFDRDGSIVAVHRKPLRGGANCNITNIDTGIFSTDFGATFGLLMEEDLVLKKVEDMKNVKNFVLAGNSITNIPFLSANEFSAPWSYAANANLISSKGIYAGSPGLKTGSGKVIVAELFKDGGEDQPTTKFNGPTQLTNFPGEDLSQYTIRPLDIEASAHGYRETVCHDSFCCNFHLKTSFLGDPKEVNYGLVAFSGVQHFDHQRSIGVQSCALLACAGLYKRSCFLSSENTTNIAFDEVSISANFTKSSVQFPILQSTADTIVEAEDFKFNEHSTENNKQVIAKLCNIKDLLRFSVFSRDYRKDFESRTFENLNKTQVFFEYSDYISSENVEEFFDYLWIRLRVVIFIVSIYILEMI